MWDAWDMGKDEAKFIQSLYESTDQLFNNKYIYIGNRVDDLIAGLQEPETPAEKNLIKNAADVMSKYKITKKEDFISCDFETKIEMKKDVYQYQTFTVWMKPDISNGSGTVHGDWKTLFRNGKEGTMINGTKQRTWEGKIKDKVTATKKQLIFVSLVNYIRGAGTVPETTFVGIIETEDANNEDGIYIKTGDIEVIEVDPPTEFDIRGLHNDIVTELPKMYAVAKRAYDFKKELAERKPSTVDANEIPF